MLKNWNRILCKTTIFFGKSVKTIDIRGERLYIYNRAERRKRLKINSILRERAAADMVSIKDIAAECGVSIATVSKALNDHKDVSTATKDVIRDTAKKMGYLPNYQARALKTNRTYNLGVLFNERANSGLTHNYFAAVLDSFKRVAETQGYDITFISRRIGGNQLNVCEHCISRNVDGVMVANIDDYSDEGLAQLLGSDIPVVTLDYKAENKPAVMSDNYKGIECIVNFVHKMGHEKIAYIYGDMSGVTSVRIDAFRRTMEALNINIREEYLQSGRYRDPDMVGTLTRRLMEMDEPPTCILMPDDFSALGAFNALEGLGLDVPRDVSIVGYDGITLARALRPRLTTYEQDTRSLGRIAAERLISLINKKDTVDEFIEGRLLEGESVRNLTGG